MLTQNLKNQIDAKLVIIDEINNEWEQKIDLLSNEEHEHFQELLYIAIGDMLHDVQTSDADIQKLYVEECSSGMMLCVNIKDNMQLAEYVDDNATEYSYINTWSAASDEPFEKQDAIAMWQIEDHKIDTANIKSFETLKYVQDQLHARKWGEPEGHIKVTKDHMQYMTYGDYDHVAQKSNKIYKIIKQY